jgi:hypothetical protein
MWDRTKTIASALIKAQSHIAEQKDTIAELEAKLDESYDWWVAQERLIDDYKATIAELKDVLEAYYHGVATVPCIKQAEVLLADRLAALLEKNDE